MVDWSRQSTRLPVWRGPARTDRGRCEGGTRPSFEVQAFRPSALVLVARAQMVTSISRWINALWRVEAFRFDGWWTQRRLRRSKPRQLCRWFSNGRCGMVAFRAATPMDTRLLINAVVQQTMVFIAQLATAGGVRAPLVHVADQVFRDLTRELLAQGLKKKVIADMFGMGLRTYQRRLHAAEQSKTDVGRTVWEAVFAYLQQQQPVSGAKVLQRFAHDDREIISGVLNDFVHSGLVYRAGRGDDAVYRIAPETDFQDEASRQRATDFVVWLTVYREGPLAPEQVQRGCGLPQEAVEASLERLLQAQKVDLADGLLSSQLFEVPWDTTRGWEAAVLDHFRAMVTTIGMKLGAAGESKGLADTVGGSTWTLDIWPGHPFEAEAKGTLAELRQHVERLRKRIDQFNGNQPSARNMERVVVYLGQHVRSNNENDA